MQSRHADRMHAALHAFEMFDSSGAPVRDADAAELAEVDVSQHPEGSVDWAEPESQSPDARRPSGSSEQRSLQATPDTKGSDGGHRLGPGSMHAPNSRGSSSHSQVIFPGDSVSQQNRHGVPVRPDLPCLITAEPFGHGDEVVLA
jgi:hypothetical protein